MYLHIEGINHDWVLFDTNDISTIRGGSHLLESLATDALKDLKGVMIDSGASKVVIKFDAATEADVPRSLAKFVSGPTWSQFSLATGIGDTPVAAGNAAQISALSMWSCPPPRDLTGGGPDPEDHTRAATVVEHAKARETGPDGSKQETKRLVAPFVALRRAEARRERPILFTKGGFAPPLHFEDIVWSGNRNLPTVVRDKIAVIAVDGMGGGVLAQSYGGVEGGFAHAMARFRERLAHHVNIWIEDEGLWFTVSGSKQKISQCDVLLWGGDDMVFALPASHAVRFVQMVMGVFAAPFDPGVVEAPFAHRFGCVIANVKTPFRQLLRLAQEAEYSVKSGLPDPKGAPESAVTFAVFESLALPHENLGRFRRALYGAGFQARAEVFLRPELDRFADFCCNGVQPDDGHGTLSITQINRVLEAIRRQTDGNGARLTIATEGANEIARGVLIDHYRRVNGTEPPIAEWMAGIGGRGVALWLAQVAQFRPYMIGENMQHRSETAA